MCVVDDFSREGLACVVDTSLSGVRVVRELERLTGERATPLIIVSDNGIELTMSVDHTTLLRNEHQAQSSERNDAFSFWKLPERWRAALEPTIGPSDAAAERMLLAKQPSDVTAEDFYGMLDDRERKRHPP